MGEIQLSTITLLGSLWFVSDLSSELTYPLLIGGRSVDRWRSWSQHCRQILSTFQFSFLLIWDSWWLPQAILQRQMDTIPQPRVWRKPVGCFLFPRWFGWMVSYISVAPERLACRASSGWHISILRQEQKVSIEVGFWSSYDFILFLLPLHYLQAMSIKWQWGSSFKSTSVSTSVFSSTLCI